MGYSLYTAVLIFIIVSELDMPSTQKSFGFAGQDAKIAKTLADSTASSENPSIGIPDPHSWSFLQYATKAGVSYLSINCNKRGQADSPQQGIDPQPFSN